MYGPLKRTSRLSFSFYDFYFQRLLLDAQNCSGESALWRSMFYGKLSMSHLLLDEGAASFTMARVQENILRRARVIIDQNCN